MVHASPYMHNPTVSNACVQAEEYAETRNYVNAVSSIEEALALTSSVPAEVFSREISRVGTTRLALESIRLHYRSLAYRGPTDSDAVRCKRLIQDYSGSATLQQWQCFKMLYRRLVDYYCVREMTNEVIKAYEQVLAYDPSDEFYFRHYLMITLNRYKLITTNTRHIVTAYKKTGSLWNERYDFLECKLLHYEGKDSYRACMNVLGNNPNINEQMITPLLEFTHAGINKKNRKEYTTNLMNFAIAQPPDDKRVNAVAMALAERKKWIE